MRLVILESPYATNPGYTVEENVEYARCCMRDALRRNEAPLASHLLYTQPGVLRDELPHERERGIEAGLAWLQHADAMVVYTDFGTSQGMRAAIERAREEGIVIEYRSLETPDAPR